MTADIITPATSPVTKEGWKYGLRIFMWVAIFLLLLYALYWFFYIRPVNIGDVNKQVSQEAANYENPAETERILLQGVKDIQSNPSLMSEAKRHAKAYNTPLEQVLVDHAIGNARQFGYIA